jgi:hypothetical protein
VSSVKGFTELKFTCDGIATGLLSVVIKSFEKIANTSAQKIKNDAPVDTGFMRDEVKVDKPTNDSVRIKANAYYSFFVDQGHRTRSGTMVQADPFFSTEVDRLKTGTFKSQVDTDVGTFLRSKVRK